MKHARRHLQRIARLAAVGGLLCGGVMVTNAVASEPAAGKADRGGVSDSADLVTTLLSRLGAARTAGSWTDAEGRPVVAVTDSEAAAEVREAGARAEIKRYSMRDLRSATESLGEAPRVAGTSWAMNYATNEVVVHADSSVSAADWSRLSAVAEQIGGTVRMERTTGSFTTRIDGAAPIFTNNERCSVGFNVTDGQNDFVLTAGHCGPTGTTWFQDIQGNQQLGTTVATNFPESDFSLVQYQDPGASDVDGTVDIGNGQAVRITGAADPVVGQQVFRSGSTSGLRSGQVTALNATVNYPEGTVTGLIQTSVCAEPGDSGGPMFADGLALGVTSGGTGDCATGGITFFQPVTTAMAALGVRLAGAEETGSGTATADPSPTADAAAGAGAAAPGTAGAPGSPELPGASGTSGARVTGIVDNRTLIPGLVVIAMSLIALFFIQRSWSEKASYRSQYAQSWS
jgi:streptogrisin D